MQQIKIFKGIESEIAVLEREINAWLAQTRCNVLQIFGNIAPQSTPGGAAPSGGLGASFTASDIVICVLYEKK